LHDHVRRLDEMGASAWIVDLRFNSGGNMWPMLAGVGPLLNGNRVGAFVREGEDAVNWEYSEGRAGTPGSVSAVIDAPYTLRDPNAKLLVLIGKYCTSSGEAIAVAFRGRENTRFLGKPTGGATTSTQTIWMGDGAMLFVTNAVYADRTGTVYGGKVIPDLVIADSPEELAVPRPPLVEDPAISDAVDWLRGK
jgi:C-terminal processing protease CtpA/Prc